MHETRESWYKTAAERIEQQVFVPAGYIGLPKYRIGCGGAVIKSKKYAAECFSRESSGDNTYEIFISPRFADPRNILLFIVHELCHVVAGTDAKHKKPFIEVMRAVGMVQPWKDSIAGGDLVSVLHLMLDKLGPFPHAPLIIEKGSGEKGSRLIKTVCPKCGYIARVTRKWLDEVGAPLCPADAVAFKEEAKPTKNES